MLLDYDPHHLSSYGVAQARVARCGCVWIELKESVGINITTETVGVRVCAEHRRSTTPFEEFVGKHVIATAMFGTISALWVRPVE